MVRRGAGEPAPAGSVRGMRAPIELDLHLPNFNYPGVGSDAVFEKLVEIATTAAAESPGAPISPRTANLRSDHSIAIPQKHQ